MNRVMVVGGASGVGLSLALFLAERADVEEVCVVDKKALDEAYEQPKLRALTFDITSDDYGPIDALGPIDGLYITAGFGHLGRVEAFDEGYIRSIFAVNAEGPIRLLRHFYDRLLGPEPFVCAVMVSIAGRLCSPMFAYYSATKAALRMFVEAANVELEVVGSPNRILEVSPGSLRGTSFGGGPSDPAQTMDIARQIVAHAEGRSLLFIPQWDEVYAGVVGRYHDDPHGFGVSSYWYKVNGRKHVASPGQEHGQP